MPANTLNFADLRDKLVRRLDERIARALLLKQPDLLPFNQYGSVRASTALRDAIREGLSPDHAVVTEFRNRAETAIYTLGVQGLQRILSELPEALPDHLRGRDFTCYQEPFPSHAWKVKFAPSESDASSDQAKVEATARQASSAEEPHLVRTHLSTKLVAPQGLLDQLHDHDKQILEYAVAAYGFLVQRNATVSMSQWADLIAKTYDESEPRNSEAIRVIRSAGELRLHQPRLRCTSAS